MGQYVLDRLTWLYKHRELVKGLKFVEEPKVLRFFFGRFNALDGWGEKVARHLFMPSYKITFLRAVRARLLRNYWGIYAVLLISWFLKVLLFPDPAHTWGRSRSTSASAW